MTKLTVAFRYFANALKAVLALHKVLFIAAGAKGDDIVCCSNVQGSRSATGSTKVHRFYCIH